MGEAVGNVLLISCMVGIDAHRSIEVQTGVVAGHEGTVDRYLVEVDANAVILCVAVEEHAELEERIRGIFNAGYHTAWTERCLLDIAMVIFRVFVEHQTAKIVHLQ